MRYCVTRLALSANTAKAILSRTLPPDLKDWLPADDVAHFVVTAAEQERLGLFRTNPQAGGKPQYHPRLMLALLVLPPPEPAAVGLNPNQHRAVPSSSSTKPTGC